MSAAFHQVSNNKYLFIYMQAIALSLQDSSGFLNLANEVPRQVTDADSAHKASNEKASSKKASNKKEVGSCNQGDTTGKRKRKQQVRFIIYFTKSVKILKLSHIPSLCLGTLQLFLADKKSSADD